MLESGPSFTPGELAAFLGIAAFIGGLVLMGKKLFGHEPPLHKAYVDTTEYQRRQDKLDAELVRHAARRAEIYDEQKMQSTKLAALEAESRNQTEALRDIKEEQRAMRDRFDQSSQRTLELLTEIAKRK
jgi:hypothetical protein